MKRRIGIRLSEDGNLEYAPRRVHVNRNDDVEWVVESDNIRAFAVHFQGISPSDRVRYRCQGKRSIGICVRPDTPIGLYKYFVAVVDIDQNVWTDDPEMIVDR